MTREPLNAAYDGRPEDYDALRACWLNERRLRFLRAQLEAEAPGRVRHVVELGSGTGWLLPRLARDFPHIRFHGVDPLPEYVAFARRRARAPNLEFLVGEAEAVHRLGLPPADVILSNDVLHHIARLEEAVAAVSQLAAPRCVWHAIEPNWLNAYSLFRQATTHGERPFWPWRFEALARRRNWRKQRTSHLFLIPPFVSRAPEWCQRLERRLEWIPLLAGGIHQQYEFGGDAK